MQEHALAIDVAHFQAQALAQAQTAGVDRDQGHPMIQESDLLEDAPHLRGREHHGQFELRIGPDQFQFVGPGALEGLLPEDFDGADGLGGGLAGDLLFGFEMDAILADFLGRDEIGGFLVELAELAQAVPVGLFRARTDGQKFQIIGVGF